MTNGKSRMAIDNSKETLRSDARLLCSSPMLLCRSRRVLYSQRFFGVGWTVAGAGDFRFQISNSDLRFTGSETAGARGKSEHRRATDWLTARRGDPTTSATENKPADGSSARSDRSTGDG